MIKSQRPLGLVFVSRDDNPERVIYQYPYVIESPLENIEEEIQLDTNSILIESNKLVDGQRISNSADDSDGDIVNSFEKSSNEEINKLSSSPIASNNLRTTHKSEKLTKSTAANYEDEDRRKEEEHAKIRHNWRSQLFCSIDDPTALKEKDGRKDSMHDYKSSINKNNHYSSGSLRKTNNSTDSMQNGESNRHEDSEMNKRREKKNRFPIKVIAAMLQPIEDLSGVPFEVKINKVRFVCNPWHIRHSAQCIAVVFVLHASCSDQIVEAYQNLSRKIAIAIETG